MVLISQTGRRGMESLSDLPKIKQPEQDFNSRFSNSRVGWEEHSGDLVNVLGLQVVVQLL